METIIAIAQSGVLKQLKSGAITQHEALVDIADAIETIGGKFEAARAKGGK